MTHQSEPAYLSGPDAERPVEDAGLAPGSAAGLSWLWPYADRPDECPDAPHRGPEGPNEDVAQCGGCGWITYSKRPPGETFGLHRDDCSLPIDHESFCQPGGSGHPRAEVIRGY